MAEIGKTAEQGRHATVAMTGPFREHHLEPVCLALVTVGDLALAEDVLRGLSGA